MQEIEAALEHWEVSRQASWQDCLPTLNVALTRAKGLDDAILTGRVLLALGQAASMAADGAGAIGYADQALELLEPRLPNTARQVVTALRVIGKVHYDYGNDDQALVSFSRALDLCDLPNERIVLQGNIASIQLELGQLEVAVSAYEQLIVAAQTIGEDKEVHFIRSNLALALQKLAAQQDGNTALATRAMQEAQLCLDGAQRDGLKSTEAQILTTIGSLLLDRGQLALARQNFEASLALAVQLQVLQYELAALVMLARIAMETGDLKQALALANQALEKASNVHFQEYSSQAHTALALIHEKNRDYQQALIHERKHHELDKLVKSLAATKRAENLIAQTQLERTRLEARLEFLRVKNQAELQRVRTVELEQRVLERTLELENSQLEMLNRLAVIGEYHDYETSLHTQRVGQRSADIARVLALETEYVLRLQLASQLHDIGKVSISDLILCSQNKLNPDEFALVKEHTVVGAKILSGSQSLLICLAEEIALSHHEHWDGNGYPLGLRGQDIPLSGRIVAVADVFDALISERPYKRAWTRAEALLEIRRLSGTHFDPKVVEAFLSLEPLPSC